MQKEKIKLSFITPTAFIEEFGSQGDFILALSHLIDLDKENEYEKAIKKTGLPIICDNGLFEKGEAEEIETLIKKAIKIGAHTFFSPDVMFDKERTQEKLEEAIKKRKEMGLEDKIKIAAVVQASNEKDYWDQLKDFNENPNIDLIGIPIKPTALCIKIPIMEWSNDGGETERFNGLKITKARVELLNQMSQKDIKWKKCHLLGLGNSYSDVEFAQFNCPWVVSNDSGLCFQSGLYGRLIMQGLYVYGGKIEEKIDFSLKEINFKQKEDIQANINKIKERIQYV